MKKSKNFIISYIRGETSLVKSYWLVATLSVIIVASPLIYAEANDFKISQEFANFLIYYIISNNHGFCIIFRSERNSKRQI